MKKIFSVTISLPLIILFVDILFAYDGSVHSKINENAVGYAQLDYVLKNCLGISSGIEVPIAKGKKEKKAWEWLAYGGEAEDFGRFGKISKLTTRAFNHFHDPLKSWSKAGLDNVINEVYLVNYLRNPVSPVLWGLDPGRQAFSLNTTGDWSWKMAREYYYMYLAGNDFFGNTVAVNRDDREAAFADCFRAVGQEMHLLQDMSVPLHTRNDVHLLPLLGIGRWTFETYTKKHVDTGKLDYSPDQPGDLPNPDLIADPRPDSLYSNLPPVSGLFDRNVYAGLTTPGGDAVIGLAEYSNANFLTNDTLWKYPHPALDETNYDESIWLNPEEVDAEDGKKDKRIYFKRNTGEQIDHLMAAGYWTFTILEEYGEREDLKWTFLVDKTCFADYAAKLVPRAVGYSAALLDYFFRGEMDLTVDPVACRIANKSEELMGGKFELYYDTVNDERKPVLDVEKWPWSFSGWISAGDQSPDLEWFAVPEDAQPPGEYMLVFRGDMGGEQSNAVAAAKVTIPAIRISLPEEGYYALNGDEACVEEPAACGFNKIVINAESMSTQAGAITTGAVALTIKYRQGLSEQFVTPPGMTSNEIFTIHASLPDLTAIPSGQTTRLEFDLGGQQIPLWATDVHLFLTLTEYVDDQPGTVCLGYKDISEPTPFDFFNYMDKTCLGSNLYEAGSQEAIEYVDKDGNGDGIADEWDVYQHTVNDLSVKFADCLDCGYDIPFIDAGDFYRVFVLIDYDSFDMNVGYYKSPLHPDDPFIHSKYITKVNSHHGVLNQFIKEEFVGCPSPPCRIRYYPTFNPFRGINRWGGSVIINSSYPSGSQCAYGE